MTPAEFRSINYYLVQHQLITPILIKSAVTLRKQIPEFPCCYRSGRQGVKVFNSRKDYMEKLQISQEDIRFFEANGYLVIKDLIDEDMVEEYKKIYNDFIDGKIDVGANCRDLKGEDQQAKEESITQIMVPSRHFPALRDSTYYNRITSVARQLLGDDLEIDFNMPDKRAISAWMPLDEATLNKGCMWYVPASHLKPMRKHDSSAKNGALICEGDENEAVYVELPPGSVVLHHGATVHYSRGNITNSHRRAMIVNLRPISMIDYERKKGFDHTGENKIRNENTS